MAAKELLRLLKEGGFDLENHMADLSDDALACLDSWRKSLLPLARCEENLIVSPMMVAEFAQKTGLPINEVILALLKEGILATKNQVISEAAVEKLIKFYGLSGCEPEAGGPSFIINKNPKFFFF